MQKWQCSTLKPFSDQKCDRNGQVNSDGKPKLKIVCFQNFKHWYQIHTFRRRIQLYPKKCETQCT